MRTGYALIDVAAGQAVCEWHGGMPPQAEYRAGGKLVLRFMGGKPGDVFTGVDGKEYRLVARRKVERPSPWHAPTGNTVTFAETEMVIDPQWTFRADDARAALIGAVKANAGQRIEAVAPDYKQRNMLGRSAEFLRKGEANLNTAEQAELAQIDAVWAWIKETRAHSEVLEAEIATLETEAELTAWEPHGWPEFGA